MLINDDGSTQTKSQFLASIKQTNTQEQQVSPESINVRVYGTVAIATGVFRQEGWKAASIMFATNDLWIHGYSKKESGCALQRTQHLFFTERLRVKPMMLAAVQNGRNFVCLTPAGLVFLAQHRK